jgi:hypothetical protein
MLWRHLAWVGVFASIPPPPDWVMHVRTPFGLRGTWRGLEWLVWQYKLNVGVGCSDCTWWEGVTVTPPPIIWVMHARYHLPTRYSITISKLKFETYFEIIINGNFLRLMFVYTTSNIYLTPGLNFEIYILNFREIVTNSWSKRNNVVYVISPPGLKCEIHI